MKIDYQYNGTTLSDIGVHVSASLGLLEKPNRKPLEIYEYPEEDGHVVDLKSAKFEARKITLNCFIKAINHHDFIVKTESLNNVLFEVNELKELSVKFDGQTKLTYSCYCAEITKARKRWSDGIMVGTFDIVFIEPQPPTIE